MAGLFSRTCVRVLGEELASLGADLYALGQTAARALQVTLAPLYEDMVDTATRLDDRYQQVMVERVDPLFGGTRHQQFHEMSSGTDAIPLSPEERQLNRNLAYSTMTVASAILARTLFRPFYLVSLGLAAYIIRIPAQRAYLALAEERRVKLPVLVTLNLLGTWLGGYFIIGGASLVAFVLGEKLVAITRDRSHKSLISVFGRQVRTAWVVVDGAETEVPVEQVRVGEVIVVHAGQTVPVDGIIVRGMATVDQHALTGEAQPAEKTSGDQVFGTTMVLAGKVYLRVEKTGQETVAAQIVDVLNRTSSYEMSIESKGMELAHNSALPTLALGVLAWPFAGYEAMVAVLGASIGLNIKITGPIAMLNHLNIAATHGILVKDGRSLELLPTVDTVVFDKTGTLTLEQPRVGLIHPCGDLDADSLLTYAAAAERRQTHPIARAILEAAAARGLRLPDVDQARYDIGYGIRVQIGDRRVRVGSDRYMAEQAIAVPAVIQAFQAACHAQGHSLVMVAVDDGLAGAIELEPTLRPEVTQVIAGLQERGLELLVISGDQEQPTRRMARQLGIARHFAGVLPQNKAALVEQLQREGHMVCFVGDGINDAIAMKTSNVSISLRGATTAATDTAQIVLMEQSLHQLPYLFQLSEDFDANMYAGLTAAVLPGLLIVGGAYLQLLGIAGSLAIWTGSLVTGLSIAGLPLLTHRRSDTREGPEEHVERSQVPRDLALVS